jgi:hypothetical protein
MGLFERKEKERVSWEDLNADQKELLDFFYIHYPPHREQPGSPEGWDARNYMILRQKPKTKAEEYRVMATLKELENQGILRRSRYGKTGTITGEFSHIIDDRYLLTREGRRMMREREKKEKTGLVTKLSSFLFILAGLFLFFMKKL